MRDNDFLDQVDEVIKMVRLLRNVNDSVTNVSCSKKTWKDTFESELFSFREKVLKEIRDKVYYVIKFNDGYITKVGHKLLDVMTTPYLADKVINFLDRDEAEQFLVEHQWLIDSIEIKAIKKGFFDEWEEIEND